MRYLLDTHILLWFLQGSKELSNKVEDIIVNPEEIIFISVASVWEIELKSQIGKLSISPKYSKIIEEDFDILEIDINHVLGIKKLKPIHKDPFDRILLSQAKVEYLTLITSDENILKYKQKVLKN